ncbi:MAG TPA: CPBP family intramembrane glutamic endopeptidase [Bacteroidales bacterium]
MGDNNTDVSIYERSTLVQLYISVLTILVVGMFLFFVFVAAGMIFFGIDISKIGDIYSNHGESNIAFLRYLLITQQISFFIIPSVILFRILKPSCNSFFVDFKTPERTEIVLVVILVICIFPVTYFTGQINSGMHLPDWLSGIEKWMLEKENDANGLIESIISSDSFWILLLNILIIAVLPAIGEELIFRGIFQKIFYKLFKSDHLAIWFTAFLFSTLHLQFYGFLPRLILGLVFGYLFYFSGNLWLPMLAHFLNNAVPTIASYFQRADKADMFENISLWKQLLGLLLPIIVIIIIFNYFREKVGKGVLTGKKK